MARFMLTYGARLAATLLLAALVAGCAAHRAATTASTTEQMATIKHALADMKGRAAMLGAAKLNNGALCFGDTAIAGNNALVDALQARYGGTATLFVAQGEGFVRVSTNVINDGKRAVGTELDPNGPVIQAIRTGQPFYGVVDILGRRYNTGYEPIRDNDGGLIGIYYFGYPVHE